MFTKIKTQRIATGSLFKLIGLGLTCTFVPLTTIMGMLSLFGAQTIQWHGQALTGISGLLSSPLTGLLLAGIFTLLIGGCTALGLWLYSLFRPITVLAKFSDVSASAVWTGEASIARMQT